MERLHVQRRPTVRTARDGPRDLSQLEQPGQLPQYWYLLWIDTNLGRDQKSNDQDDVWPLVKGGRQRLEQQLGELRFPRQDHTHERHKKL